MIGFAGDGGGKGHRISRRPGVLAGDGVGLTPAGYGLGHGDGPADVCRPDVLGAGTVSMAVTVPPPPASLTTEDLEL